MKQEDKIKCIVSDNGTIIPINTISAISGKNCIHHIWTNRDQDHEGYRLSDEQYNILIKELKILSNDPDEEKCTEEISPKFKVGDTVRNIDSGELFHIEKVGSRNYWDGRDSFCIINQEQWERVEQKSSWSKEDEMQLDAAIHLVSSTGHIETANWLKALKDRVQPKQCWSEEDEDMLYKVIAVINRLCAENKEYVWSINTLKNLFYWLKSLKEKIQSLPKQEWSEEDKKMKDAIYSCVDSHYDGLAKTSLLIWIKSLKDRIQPQQGWSEEDKVIRNALIKFVELLYSYGSGIYDLDKNQFLDWLQALENRMISK